MVLEGPGPHYPLPGSPRPEGHVLSPCPSARQIRLKRGKRRKTSLILAGKLETPPPRLNNFPVFRARVRARIVQRHSTKVKGMLVRFWGVPGSTPTPQPENLRYGGNTSCV